MNMGLQLNFSLPKPAIVVIIIAVLAIAAIIIYAAIDNVHKKGKNSKAEQSEAAETKHEKSTAVAAKAAEEPEEEEQSFSEEESTKEENETAPTAEAEEDNEDEEEEDTGMVVETKSQSVSEDKEKSAAKSYHISKRKSDGMWQIKLAGGKKAIKLFKTQQEAIDYCKTLAENQDANVTVHKKDGSFRKQNY